MLFRQLFDATSSTYTYLIASDMGREAIIIDPVLEQISLYNELLRELKLQLVLALDTHTHADHITGTGTLKQQYHCDIALGEGTQATCATITLKENDYLPLKDIKLLAIATPGHTNDSFSYYMHDRVFTGDTLLIRSTGRTDFQEGDAYKQYDSIFNKLLKFPETTLVYPAHDYKGRTVSTLYEEKNFNPRLQVTSAQQYAEVMNALNLPKPKMMDVAVPANLNGGVTV